MGSPITTHVLDTAQGHPAPGIEVTLEHHENGAWKSLARGVTNQDGRIGDLLPDGAELSAGVYRLVFHVGPYHQASGTKSFYPHIPVVFEIENPRQHYHVPLLLNPYGYSTYRGS